MECRCWRCLDTRQLALGVEREAAGDAAVRRPRFLGSTGLYVVFLARPAGLLVSYLRY